jgi:alpha-ketoglutaric semialdehyde dehydrogenase
MNKMKLTGLSIIGQSRAPAAGSPKTAVNPATGSAVGPDYFHATTADVDAAAKLAAEAFMEFKRWPGKRREDFLKRIAELLETYAVPMIEIAHQETALPVPRLQGEMARTCFQLRLYGAAAADGLCVGARIDHGYPGRKPLPKPELRSMMVPLGPVVVFSASNFPFAFSVAGGDTASAFAAGCPVIVKPHHGHPGTSEMAGLLIQQAARECGAPEGVFSMLYGDGRDIGIALVGHPCVKAVGFTGSRTGGRALMDAAAARPDPVPVYAEMGSINPVFMFAGALDRRADELAAGLQASVTLGVGQFCTNPGLVFVEAGVGAKKFLAKLESLVASTPPGTMLTSGLCSAYRAGVAKLRGTTGVTRTAQVSAEAGPGSAQAGAALFITDTNVFLQNPGLMDEVFGPSTLVVECPSRADMIAAARRLEGQLTATVHATPEELAANRELLEILETKAGRLVFNGFPTGVEVAHAMTHGGPYPATSDGRSTSVGTRAIERFLRPVSYQDFPDAALPQELQEGNPLKIARLENGKLWPG